MSSIIRNKLLQYETAPPEGAWISIASELDEAAANKVLASKLTDIAVIPPESIWGKLSAALDDTFSNENISARLYAAEVTPPIAAWSNITAALDAEKEAPVPERRRLSPLLKYAAAAVVTGIIAFSAFKFYNTDRQNNTIADQKTSVSEAIGHDVQDITAPANENAGNQAAADPDEARNDAALEASKHTYAKLDISRSSKAKAAIAAGFRFSNYTSPAEAAVPCTSGCEETTDNNLANRYIVLMTPEGHVIRMSKKLSNMVCCVSGEEADAQCKSQIEKWKKQLACSEASHPGNFLDILSLVGSLQENQ